MFRNSLLGKKTFISRQLCSSTLVSLIACASDYTASIFSAAILGAKTGETGLIVVGIMTPVLSIEMLICDFLCGGAVYIRNLAISEGKKDKGDRIAGNALIISLAIGIFLFFALYFGAETYVSFFGLSEEIVTVAVKYIKLCAITPLLGIMSYYAYEFVFRLGAQFASMAMVFSCSAGLIVLGLVFVDKYGIVGMAYASIIAASVTVLIGIVCMFRHKEDISFKFKYVKEEMHELYDYGFAYSQDSLYYPLQSALTTIFIGRFLGESVIAVFTVIECVTELCSIYYGVSYAAANHLCIYVGEKNYDGMKKTIDIGLKLQGIIAIISEIAVIVFAGPIAEFMEMDEAYGDETILALRIYASTLFAYALLCFLGDLYASEEKNQACTALYFGKTIIAGTVFSIILGFLFGNIGMYVGKALEAPIAILLTYLVNKKAYHSKNLFLIDNDRGDIKSIDYDITEKDIMSARDNLELMLKEEKLSSENINKMLLAFEEVNMLTLERNKPGKYAECTVFFKEDTIEMIIRDNGVLHDISDADKEVVSLRSYIISQYIARYKNVRHINAANTNRVTLSFSR